jgi:ABC-type oligopeptide transport system ATPase subunit
VVEFGDTETLIHQPRQTYTKELFTAAELTWKFIKVCVMMVHSIPIK